MTELSDEDRRRLERDFIRDLRLEWHRDMGDSAFSRVHDMKRLKSRLNRILPKKTNWMFMGISHDEIDDPDLLKRIIQYMGERMRFQNL